MKWGKKKLTNDPNLQYPNFKRPFILTTDASNVSIGAILSQGIISQDLPIAFASLHLISQNTISNHIYLDKNLKLSPTIKLLNRYFHCLTYRTSRLVKWRLKLKEYDYEIIYKKGKQNTDADALSRIEINMLGQKQSEFEPIPVASPTADEIDMILLESNSDSPNQIADLNRILNL